MVKAPADVMEKMFGGTLVFSKAKEVDHIMPLSDLQKETIRMFLQPLGEQHKKLEWKDGCVRAGLKLDIYDQQG